MPHHRRTKIVATIGPSSSSVTMLTRMMKAGMNVARLNFSHGTHKEHAVLLKHIRHASRKAGTEVAVLQDLQGPKIRIGVLPNQGVELKQHQIITFKTGKVEYKENGPIPVTYDNMHKDVKKGHRILIADGMIELEVTSVRGRSMKAKVVVEGTIISHKGINLPDSVVSRESFTAKDKADLMWGLEHKVDWVALSFVTSPAVIKRVRKLIATKCRALGTVPPKIMVKIERQEAVDRFIDIVNEADGIMIARGDLGIEIPPQEVPIVQKEFVEICRVAGKPVVVATHMLDSMRMNPRATRAEVSDVANAVIDHADAVMLSGETAVGQYPYATVQMMADVIDETEASRLDDMAFYQLHDLSDVPMSIAQSLHVMADNGHINLIASDVVFGDVASTINIFRPNVPIVIACSNKTIARQMLLRAGVYAFVLSGAAGSFLHRMERKLRADKWVTKKQRIAFVTTDVTDGVQLTIR